MPASTLLRKKMRKVQEFRQLPTRELDTTISKMVLKEYKAGEVLWRTSSRLKLLGIIQTGEIVLERQIGGTVVRSVKLFTGDVIQPRHLGENGYSSVIVRALTDVTIHLLRTDQMEYLRKKPFVSTTHPLRHFYRVQRIVQNAGWIVIILLVATLASWRDIIRVVAGSLYLESGRANQPTLDYQMSLTFLNYAESIDRNAAFAHNQEGFLWYQNNNLQNAETAFTNAVDIDQVNGSSLNNLAVTHFALGQLQQAATNQKRAAQFDPNNATVHYNLGLILRKQNNHVDSIHELRESTYIKPNWALPYLQLSSSYIQTRDYLNAEKAASTAIKLDPEQESAYVILGIALYNQDRYQEALDVFKNALLLVPTDITALFYQALILNKLEDFDGALLVLEQLLESTSDPEQIVRISAEIEATHRFMDVDQSVDILKGGE